MSKKDEALKLARDFISAEWGFGGMTDIEPSKIVRMLEEALAEQPAQQPCEAPCGGIKCAVMCKRHEQPAQQQSADPYGEAMLSAWDALRDPGPAGDDVPHPIFTAGFKAGWDAKHPAIPPGYKPLTDGQAEAAFKAWHYKHGNNTQGIKWVDDLLRSCWKAAIEAAHGIKGQL